MKFKVFLAFAAVMSSAVAAAEDVLSVDFSKPFSMVANATKAIENKRTDNPEFFFDAAVAADLIGSSVQARNFLMYYLSVEKTSTVKVQRALVRLIKSGASIEYYERYLSAYPKNKDTLLLGIDLLRNYVNNGKTRDYRKLLELLIENYPSGMEFFMIVDTVRWAVFQTNVQGISDGVHSVKAFKASQKWNINPVFAQFAIDCVQRRMAIQEFYEIFALRPELRWPSELLTAIAYSKTVPDSAAIKAIKQQLRLYGCEKDQIAKHLANFKSRFEKNEEWKTFLDEVNSGKFAVSDKKPNTLLEPSRQLALWTYKYKSIAHTVKNKTLAQKMIKELPAILKDRKAWHFSSFNLVTDMLRNAHVNFKEMTNNGEIFPLDSFATLVFSDPLIADQNAYGYLLGYYKVAGRLGEAMKRIKAEAGKLKSSPYCASVKRGALIVAVYGESRNSPDILKGTYAYNWAKKAHERTPPEIDKLKENIAFLNEFANTPVPELIAYPYRSGIDTNILYDFYRRRDNPREKKLAPEELQFISDCEKYMKLIAVKLISQKAGILFSNPWADIPLIMVNSRLKKEDLSDPDVPFYIFAAEKLGKRDGAFHVIRLAKDLNENSLHELAYVIIRNHPELKNNPALKRLLAETQQKMPGLYPVSEKDPSYPLYVAADALARNNPERAWSLLSENLKEFDKDPLRFHPQFSLWALDQYRKVRGENDVLRNKAWEHVEKLLANESSLPVDVAAGLFLLRARIAEDRMMFEVAHAGYMQIRNHATYRNTPAGRQAMFRDVELMITMGALDAASQVAEQWTSAEEPEIRAQGHYVLSRIAFSRKDYEETRKELEKVFEIDFTHSEARLLQGEWKLATNYEVDDTQVLLGDLSDRNMIKPEQPLSITVKDRNLSVAGGGATIPVLVKTSKGNDVEKVMLYPGTRDPTLFKGSVDTVMGVAKQGDHRLQLAGDDIISYCVDPEFLKLRGLKSTAVKKLSVVDDASLQIGLLSEEESERETSIKPGVPVPVVLVDRDRSLFSGTNEVSVTVKTTSGDTIPEAKLKETGPCTGVYKADIITRIPPPRAFASDSAASFGPEDVISSVRNRPWRSMPDGQKPKFVGLDTMSSHIVKTATVKMPQPETVAEVRLWGSVTGGEEILLGTYPHRSGSSMQGINIISMGSSTRNRTEFIRELSRRNVKPQSIANIGIDRNLKNRDWIRHRVLATMHVPQTDVYKLRIKPKHAVRHALYGFSGELYIDGRRVHGWWRGADLARKTKPFTVDFMQGVHTVELYGESRDDVDSFELCLVGEDGDLKSIPAEWFDAKEHPEIAAFHEEKCKIMRSQNGFNATFDKPFRLRSLKWEFVEFAGNSLEVSKLSLVTSNNDQIIPSEHDFTESLGNDTLEVAPGDEILVSYEDEVTSSGKARTIERKLQTIFSNGKIRFLYEDIKDTPAGVTTIQYFDAYRVSPGDVIVLEIIDNDLNVSKGSDSVKVLITSSSGDKQVVEAREKVSVTPDGREAVLNMNQGRFLARLRMRSEPFGPNEKRPGDVIILKEGDSITASYKDNDNINPGVPCVRKATISPPPVSSEVDIKLSHTYSKRAVDKSPEGAIRLKTVQRRGYPLACATWCEIENFRLLKEGEDCAIITPRMRVPIQIFAPKFAKHAGSTIRVEASSRNEIESASSEERQAKWNSYNFPLRNLRSLARKGENPSTFGGSIEIYSSAFEDRIASASEDMEEEIQIPVDVKSGDELVVRVIGPGANIEAEARAKIGTSAYIDLCDPTYTARLTDIHLGENFYVMVVDPDRDVSSEQDEITVKVTTKSGSQKDLLLKETLGRSGIFTASVPTSIKMLASTNAVPGDASIPSDYGDEFTFSYNDDTKSYADTPGEISCKGRILPGSDGFVRGYSKRFRDSNQAVLVQFRSAECLFEMAKDFRKLKDSEKSAAAIAEGRAILETALRDYPNTDHAAEGEYLLANLYEQLGEEERQIRLAKEKEGEDMSKTPDKADPLFREAVARFSAILSAWPEGEYAARSQYHKALCLERLGEYSQACEEYVKMTYLFPDNQLVGDAAVRLASHYFKRESRFDIAGKIYSSFRTRFPTHPQAPNALFMGGQCLIRQGETVIEKAKRECAEKNKHYTVPSAATEAYHDAVEAFITLVEQYKDTANKDLLAQALYWAGDISFRNKDFANAYIYLKRTTFEYPESKWARYARGMLLQNSQAFDVVNE